jgi:hypothetical protein
MQPMRLDMRDEPWAARPWIMAAICAVAGVLFYLFVDAVQDGRGGRWEVVGASFVAVGTLSFVLTVEKRRWWWSLVFALGWGLVTGLVGWTTHGYNRSGEVMEFPFLVSIFAVLLACPLFQAARDEGRWAFPPLRVHGHVWTDAVIGAASIAFVGISFALAWLIAGLFDLIGIDVLTDLLSEGIVGWALAGFAFGAAVGILRERDALVGTMQRLVMVVLSVLAPVLAFALVLFLMSLPLTGLAGLWDGWISAAALTLAAAGGAYVLMNAAIGLGDEEKPPHVVLHWSAMILALVVLPLATLAMTALLLRVGQYGWSPERLWGVVAAGVAIAYGVAGWWAVGRWRRAFEGAIRTLQTRLAIGVCALALILALPIVDFGAISARDQLARLASGAVQPQQFDWRAMAFDFGPAGRAALQRIAREGPQAQRALAAIALAARNRYAIPEAGEGPTVLRPLAERLRTVPAERELPAGAMALLEGTQWLCGAGQCVALWLAEDRIAVVSQRQPREAMNVNFIARDEQGEWSESARVGLDTPEPAPGDLAEAELSVGEVRQRAILVNGERLLLLDNGAAPAPR